MDISEIKVGDKRKSCDVVMHVVRLTEKSVIYKMVYKCGLTTKEANMKKTSWLKTGTPC